MVLKKEDYTVRVPRSQRGGEVVEPLIREQWFVRMQPLAQPALTVPSLLSVPAIDPFFPSQNYTSCCLWPSDMLRVCTCCWSYVL